ncbi:MAG: RnfABCDGE type electron transport complex subunit D [Woeseiaceae bacterium]
MKPLRSFLDRLEPLFTKGGRFEGLYALFEAIDTFFYSPPDLARGSPHVRDALDLKRVMITVVIASAPAAVFGMWNTGFQANTAMASLGLAGMDGWRGLVLGLLGAGYDPASIYDCVLQGALYFVPIYIVTMVVGLFWEVLFSAVRNHEVNEGFFVTGWLYEGMQGLAATGLTWTQAFIGQMQGSIGETSTLLCLVGGAILVFTRIASWRIIVAVFAGLIIPTLVFHNPESGNPMMTMPWQWHVVVGGFAFGAVFMATDPVSASQTNAGKWIFGLLIGFMTWLIRVVNPAFPEGIMLAILFANVFAPVIDHFVIRANVKRRLKRNA